MPLSIVCNDANGSVRCVIEGELDLASQDAALAELIPAIERSGESVILDLARVEFIDSTGLRVLIACQQQAAEAKTRLLIASPSNAVQQIFDLTKLNDRFEFAEDG